MSLAEYVVAVKNIAEDAKTASSAGTEYLCGRMKSIIQELPQKYGDDAELLAAMGDAWGELDHFKEAIEAYNSALQAQQTYAPICAAEQLANFKVRRAVEQFKEGEEDKKGKAGKLIDEAIELLESLNTRFGESVERLALLGGSYKRRAEIDVNNMEALLKNMEAMRASYIKSYEKSLELNGKVYSYPLINGLTARWLLHQAKNKRDDLKDFDVLLESAKQANMVPELNREYFWKAIAVNECNLLGALKNNKLSAEKAGIIADSFEKIGQVDSSARQMRSVVEHVEFLCTMTVLLKVGCADKLQLLSKRLRRIG